MKAHSHVLKKNTNKLFSLDLDLDFAVPSVRSSMIFGSQRSTGHHGNPSCIPHTTSPYLMMMMMMMSKRKHINFERETYLAIFPLPSCNLKQNSTFSESTLENVGSENEESEDACISNPDDVVDPPNIFSTKNLK